MSSFDLYYLFKGIIKAIPAAGPVLEEIVFNQYENTLKDSNTVEELSEKIVFNIKENEFEIKRLMSNYMMALLRESQSKANALINGQNDIKFELDTIKGILEAISFSADSKKSLEDTLNNIKLKRYEAINNLSSTQVKVLTLIPSQPESISLYTSRQATVNLIIFSNELVIHRT